MHSIPPDQFDTPFAAEFLATSLSQLIALGRYEGRRWTKQRIADFIKRAQDIPGEVSDTTIGRLLDPGYDQEPSPETLATIGAFLVKVRAMTADQLRLSLASRPLAEATAFAALFSRPRTQSYRMFLQSLRGRYSALEVRGRRLLLVDLVLRPLSQSDAVLAQETLVLFDIATMDQLKRSTRNFSSDGLVGLTEKIRTAGGERIASYVHSGVAAVTPDIMALLLRREPQGVHSIATASEIAFGADEGVEALTIERSAGWRPANAKQPVSGAPSLQNVVQEMMRRLILMKWKPAKIKARRNQSKMADLKSNTLDFFSISMVDVKKKTGKAEQFNLNEIIEANDFELFQQALGAGADPNTIEPYSGNPIIFGLAANGRREWVEALLATGHCDLMRVDADGHRASYAPAVTARMFAPTGPAETVDLFTGIARLLGEQELLQLKRRQANSPPVP